MYRRFTLLTVTCLIILHVSLAMAGPASEAMPALNRGDYAEAIDILTRLANQGDGEFSILTCPHVCHRQRYT